MNDDYNRGLVMGLAKQPLYVVQGSGTERESTMSADFVICDGYISDESHSRFYVED